MTTWGASVREFVGAVEKNAFAAAKYNAWAVCGAVALFAVVWGGAAFGPLISIALDSPALSVAFIGLLLNAVPAALIARRLGFGSPAGLYAPFMPPLMAYAGVRSMLLTLRRGGVSWRDTNYSLNELKSGRFR